jgi:ribosome-associated protein
MESCREKLRQLLVSSLKSPKKRISTKPSKAARQRRLDEKKLNAKRKQSRNWAD